MQYTPVDGTCPKSSACADTLTASQAVGIDRIQVYITLSPTPVQFVQMFLTVDIPGK